MTGKVLSNGEVATQLKEVLAAMEIGGENRFSIRAYQNVISSIDNLTISVHDLWESDRLNEIAGIGSGLAGHLDELFKTGKVKEWEFKKKDLPKGMFELLVLRGVGPKTAFKLAKEFDLEKRDNALEKIKKAAGEGRIEDLPGFGEKSQQEILDSINTLKKSKQEKQRLLLSHAEEISQRIIKHLKEHKAVKDVVGLGSLRRRASTVGDIDLAVSSNLPSEVIEHFVNFSEIKDVETKGDKMSTVILNNDVQVDILVSAPDSFGSMLQHFTGSKQHNILLREFALEQGKSLSQYGIKIDGKLTKFKKEEDFYKELGLPHIPPELREGKNEVELASKEKLPKLIEASDVKGDLHWHTTDSDGLNSLQEMVDKAISLGYEYAGVADHAPSVQSRGKYEVLGIIDKKRRQIEQINKEGKIKLLFGYEVNILKDASLGMPDELLEKLDFVVASIHTAFDQDKETITNRLLSAIENPLVDIIAHPTGRLINERKSYEVDWDKVFDACIKHNTMLEINAHPTRLDLPDHLVLDAVKKGVKIVINTDAHSVEDMDLMRFGVDVARRGWCEVKDIVNAKPVDKLLNLLHV